MPRTQANRYIAIYTSLGDDKLLLQSFRATEQLGRPFEIELSLATEEASIDAKQLLGKNVSIRMEVNEEGTGTRYFNGYVSRFVMAGNAGHVPRYHMTVVPYIWMLGRTSDCRIWQNEAASEIVTGLIKEWGYSDLDIQLSGSYVPREYCVQYRETTLNYCHRLLEEEGIYYFFKHESGKHTLVFADNRGAHPVLGYPLHYRKQPDRNFTQTVSQWTWEQEVKSGAYALLDFNFKKPKSAIKGQVSSPGGYDNDSYEMLDYPGGYDASAEGDRLSRVRLEELQAASEVVRGSTNCRELTAGTIFTLADHPDASQNAEWLVTSVTIDASVTDYSTNLQGDEDHFSCSFTAIPAQTQYRSPRVTPEPVIPGPQSALVVGTAGDEITTDEFGRVKVQFYWDRLSKANETSSCWVRVMQQWAGKKWGIIFIPRIGHEVIVDFIDGDPDRPIITGRVYNGDSKPPWDLPANATMSTIKTSSSKGGAGFNELRFEDKKGSEQIFIHAEKNKDVRVKNNSFETVLNDRHHDVQNDQFEYVKRDRHEIVDRDHLEKITRDRNVTVQGKESIQVVGSHSFNVKDDVIEEFNSSHSEVVTKDYYLKAENICIEAGTNITIKVGQSYIVIEAGGIKLGTTGQILTESTQDTSMKATAGMKLETPATMAIKGMTVSMKADTTVAVEGGVQAEVKGVMVSVNGSAMAQVKGGIVMIN